MAGKKTGKSNRKRTPMSDVVLETFLAQAAELYSEHRSEIEEVREESEGKSITVGISLTIDCSESAPKVTTKLSFSQKVTDSRDQVLDDPNQTIMEPVVEEAAGKKGRRGEKIKESDSDESRDEELIQDCIEVIRSEQKASVSLLQRRLKIGYTKASSMMDELEKRGVVGPAKGAEPREILNTNEPEPSGKDLAAGAGHDD